jgi:TadE-like protein
MRARGGSTQGVALLEAALVLPLLVALMLNVANFGMYIYAWVTVNNAARTLLEYRVYNGVVLGYPPSPSVTQLQTLVTAEFSSLPNSASVTWVVCGPSKANGTLDCQGTGTAFVSDSDPADAAHYALYSAKVSYTFHTLFAPVTLPLGYTVSGLPGSVSRQVSMRSMQ